MKSRTIILPILVIAFVLFSSSCDNNQVVNPDSTLPSGKYESVRFSTNYISVNYQISQSSSSKIGGTHSSCDTSIRTWQYSGTITNTDLSASSINKDTLKLTYFKMELMNFGSFVDSKAVIKFNPHSKIIDYFSFVSDANSDNSPQDAKNTSVSSVNNGITLKNVPYTIAESGNILVSLKGSDISKYLLHIVYHYYSEESEGVDYDKRWQNILSIYTIPDNAIIEIEIVKAK
ncbi:MAG: hypothetical protein WCR42_12525 [bacterium]